MQYTKNNMTILVIFLCMIVFHQQMYLVNGAYCAEPKRDDTVFVPSTSCELRESQIYKYKSFIVNAGITVTLQKNVILQIQNDFIVKKDGVVKFNFQVEIEAKNVNIHLDGKLDGDYTGYGRDTGPGHGTSNYHDGGSNGGRGGALGGAARRGEYRPQQASLLYCIATAGTAAVAFA